MNIPNKHKAEAIKFIKKYCIRNLNCKDKAIHNLVILFYTELENDK